MSDAFANADAPLLFLDSGMGGLSVLAPTLTLLPRAPVVYIADFAGLPYGEKTEIEVATRVCALLGQMSERYAPRMAVIACNTASTIALAHARAILELPIVGTVPAIKPAALASRSGVIGLLGTAATLRQPYVERLAAQWTTEKVFIPVPAPELVEPAEAKLRGEAAETDVFDAVIDRLVSAHPRGAEVDQIVLGCTHFPLVEAELAAAAERRLGHRPAFIHGGDGIAHRIAALNGPAPWPVAPQPFRRIMLTTGDPVQLRPYAGYLRTFGFDVEAPALCR